MANKGCYRASLGLVERSMMGAGLNQLIKIGEIDPKTKIMIAVDGWWLSANG